MSGNVLDDPSNAGRIPSGTTSIVAGGESTRTVDLQELENRLLRGIRTVKPHATPCLKDTRTSILADVDIKINDCNGPNIIHISGAPGSGKSSISLTAKSRLHHQRRLITYFRFDRNEAVTTTPTALWCRVARDLAESFPSVLPPLLQRLRNKEVDLDSPLDIFISLVEDSLLDITCPVDRPFVIIIDALDECGGLVGQSSPDRKVLLQTLGRWSQLPKHFKLLVTSRPEGDIFRVLSSISTLIDIPSGYSITDNPRAKSSVDASNDIRLLLQNRFQDIRQRFPSLPAEWPGPPIITGMVHRAAGVFMWATTAAKSIESGINPEARLQKIMLDVSTMKPLYSLYAVVLDMAFGEIGSSEEESSVLQSVLGTMVLSKRPLGDMEYAKLPSIEPVTQLVLDGIRDGLRSVIAPGSLRFVHKSFDDFLLSEECPSKYRISQGDTHHLLTKLCLETMTERLRFNICSLETSYLKNADVPNIATKVANGIPPLLSYSCLFFAEHLCLTPFDEHLMRQVQKMILDKLLFWIEAMSLLEEINRVAPSLLLILKWLHISPIDEFKDLLHDARRFVSAFGQPITKSAPHIYISALPFAPVNSLVAQHFLQQYPWILTLSTGKSASWPSCIFTSEHHKSLCNLVAFSADDKYFVSKIDDKTIGIFDSETGNLISGPFECDDKVRSACFDPNGRQVWAGCDDKNLTCWDIETGDKHLVICISITYGYVSGNPVIRCRFSDSQTIVSVGRRIAFWNGETGRRKQVCNWDNGRYGRLRLVSISPDGCHVALVTDKFEETVRLWKVVSRSKIEGPVNSHPRFVHPRPICALSFSVDSKFAVSGSEDGTILIWDVHSGDNVGPLFNTRAGHVWAVAYSTNSHLLASTGAMVTVWNATTRELVGRLEGHTSRVVDIALSRDGQRVLTASCDKTVRMWDLGRMGGVLAASANQAHTSTVKAVAFSPCGKKLATLDRSSMQGWDTNTGKSLFKCNTGTRTEYGKLVFSPDGTQVLAYSALWDSGGVGVWNATTGALVSAGGMGEYRIDHVAFRSTDGVLVLSSNNGGVFTWSVGNGVPQKIGQLDNFFALSPDGLTAIGIDRRTPHRYIWSTTTHQPLPLVLADSEHVSGYPRAYSPSGRLFVSSNRTDQGGSTVRVWNMQTGELTTCFSTPHQVPSLAFSPDDRFIAIAYLAPSTCGEIWILDAPTGQLVSGPWSGHTNNISTLTFSPDGKTLVSGSYDHHVRVWNVAHMLGVSQGFLSNSGVPTHMEDGWAKDVGGNLLFWVPKDHRASLIWPVNRPLGDSETTTELDLSRFRYGEGWAECFAGENQAVEL